MPRGRQPNKNQYIPKSRKEIRDRAREMRKILQIDDQRAPDLVKVLDDLPAAYPSFKLKITSDSKLKTAEARAYPKNYTIKVCRRVLDAVALYGDGRARWTIAHELGHIALQHPRSPYRKRPGKPVRRADRRLEKEANLFAAEFLAPTHLATRCTTADQIRAWFRISLDAAKYRLDELKKDLEIREMQERDSATGGMLVESHEQRSLVPYHSRDGAISVGQPRRLVFVSIAFTLEMERLYREILKPTIEDAGMLCQRGDEIFGSHIVIDEIQRVIGQSSIIVAEISEFDPNVMHEIGLAQSLGKPIVLLCREGYSDDEIPFNIRHLRRVVYPNEAGGGPMLCRQLAKTLDSIL